MGCRWDLSINLTINMITLSHALFTWFLSGFSLHQQFFPLRTSRSERRLVIGTNPNSFRQTQHSGRMKSLSNRLHKIIVKYSHKALTLMLCLTSTGSGKSRSLGKNVIWMLCVFRVKKWFAFAEAETVRETRPNRLWLFARRRLQVGNEMLDEQATLINHWLQPNNERCISPRARHNS